MARFQKRPVVIEAVQFVGSNWDEIEKFTPGFRALPTAEFENGRLHVAEVYDEIHDTWMKTATGDWIIQGIKGEFYPCESVVFGESYIPAPGTLG
jgi:hypothetical protein